MNALEYSGRLLPDDLAGPVAGSKSPVVVEVLFVVVLGRRVAVSFARENVNDDGAVVFGCVLERGLELSYVVPVYGARVANAERLEECRWFPHLAHGGGCAANTTLTSAPSGTRSSTSPMRLLPLTYCGFIRSLLTAVERRLTVGAYDRPLSFSTMTVRRPL